MRNGTATGTATGTAAGTVAGAARAATPERPVSSFTSFVAPDRVLRPGTQGAAVKTLQARLKELGYHPGRVNGRYGEATQAAVWAFRKVNGLGPSGTVGSRAWNALESPLSPRMLVPQGRPTRVEIDLRKQVLVLYVRGQARLVSHISSGTAYTPTPPGDFRTTWRRSGWHTAPLGRLYNPIFFNGGIAMHGSLSVPLRPASHGCVRLPLHVADVLPRLLGTGKPVHVRGRFAY
ncbi:L,D-transpeptidase family protein [Planomonospora corallina]|uniref:L,D-transpeptidase family protein n=1 Tax=Planomonospora corallina TaxID=1806052 RepID=A0ABV8IDB0_9ACTN